MADGNRRVTHVAKNDEIRYGVEYPDDPLVKQPEVQTQIMEQFSKQSKVIANLQHNVDLLEKRIESVLRPENMTGESINNSVPRPNNIAPMAVLVENNNDTLSHVNDMLVDLLQRLEL